MSEFNTNPGLFDPNSLERKNAIFVAAGNQRIIELQTATVSPEEFTVTEGDFDRTVMGEKLLLRDGSTLVPANYINNDGDRSLSIFANDYESVPDSLEGPLLRTRDDGDAIRFQEMVGPIKETPESKQARLAAERRRWKPATDNRLGVRVRHDYWIRLEPGVFAEPHAVGKTIAARVAFFMVDAKLNGVVPIIYDESGVNDMYDPPKQFILPNPWLYVATEKQDS